MKRNKPFLAVAMLLVSLVASSAAETKGAKKPPDLDGNVWRADFNKAARQAVYAGKPLCLYFYRSGISACEKFVAATQGSAAAVRALDGWVCIAVNEWDLSNQELNTKYHIDLVPQVVLVSVRGEEIGRFADPIDVNAMAEALVRRGRPGARVTPGSPEAAAKDLPPSLRLVFEEAANVDAAHIRVAPVGGAQVAVFVIGAPESEQRAGVKLEGWGKPETKGGQPCRNTDQTGVGDGAGGFAYVVIPIKDASGSYRVTMNIWGGSFDPNAKDRTWLRFIRVKNGPGENDWLKFHFTRSEPLKEDRYTEVSYDFPHQNLPLYNGALTIGLGEGDQQICVSRVEVYHFADAQPPKPKDE